MASITVTLTEYFDAANAVIWVDTDSLGPDFDLNGQTQELQNIQIDYAGSDAGRVNFNISGSSNRFRADFEAGGRFIFVASDGATLELVGTGGDMTEPYSWTPTNSAETIAWANQVRSLSDNSITLTLTDESAVTDHTVDADPALWTFAVPQPTVTHSTPPLNLADFDQTGLEVEVLALITANVTPRGAQNTLYADTNRGGSDTVDDGELGLGPGETLITRIEYIPGSNQVRLNDNDIPGALHIGDFFAANSEGLSEWSVSFQTAAGSVSSNIIASGGGGFVRVDFSLEANLSVLSDIVTGTEFIFAIARPSLVPTDHTVDAGPALWTFAVPQPTVTLRGSHTVNAGPALWTFAVPQPQVRSGTLHQVDAGPASWTFAVPQIRRPAYSTALFAVEADWDEDDTFGHAEADITGDIVEMRFAYGRDSSSQLLGRSTAGRAMFRVRNRHGKWSRSNMASPLAGVLEVGVPVRIRTTALFAFVTPVRTLWRGYLTNIGTESEITPSGDRLLTLTAAGPIWRLRRSNPISVQAQTDIPIGEALGIVLDVNDWPASLRDIDTGQTVLPRWFIETEDSLSAIRDLEETERGFFLETHDGKLAFEDRHHRLSSAGLSSAATFSDAQSAPLPYEGITTWDIDDEIYNDISLPVRYFADQPEAVLWQFGGGNPELLPGQTLVLRATYPNSGTPQGRYVKSWVSPVVGTDVLQIGGDNADVSLAVGAGSRSLRMDITNSGPTAMIFTQIRARGVAVTESDTTDVISFDQASQDAFGPRALDLPGAWHQDFGLAQDIADYLVSRYKLPLQPVPIVLRLRGNRSPALLTQVLQRKVSDRITVDASNTVDAGANLGIGGEYFIERVEHTIKIGGAYTVRWWLGTAAGDSGYWILGEVGYSELGAATRLAPR